MSQLGIDSSQLARLMRDNWNQLGPQALADELVTMFKGNNTTLSTSGPVITNVVNNARSGVDGAPGTPGAAGSAAAAAGATGPGAFLSNDGGPVLNLFATVGDDLSFSVNFGEGNTGDLNFSLGGLVFTLGGVNIGGIDFPTTQTVPVKDGKIQLPAMDQVFTGDVVSGSGDTYTVTIYPNGPDQPGREVTAKVRQIATGEVVPPGTAVLVVQSGFSPTEGQQFYFQPAVWM